MIIILLLCLCLATGNYKVDGWMPSISEDEYLDLEQQLKIINKPPVKTIHTKFGQIVDCVGISKQFAFDHPLLKNHQLQLKPSFEDTTAKVNVHDRSTRLSKIGIDKVFCPSGTVPIRRTTKDDLIRSKWLSNFTGILTEEFLGHHFAEAILKSSSYYGVSANISLYNPTVGQGQMSAAYIWVENGSGDGVNSIFAGWQVFPELYGDNRTYFFTSWLDAPRNAGCYNLQCSGFIQIDQRFYLGSPVLNTSTYEGPQFAVGVSIYQDPATKNWWLSAENINIGYFPANLFSNLNVAEHGGWTGRTVAPVGSPSPPMGSGHFPDDNPTHACYFSQMAYRDVSGKDLCPGTINVNTYADNPSCYDVKYHGFVDQNLGCLVLFGGPGGNCGN